MISDLTIAKKRVADASSVLELCDALSYFTEVSTSAGKKTGMQIAETSLQVLAGSKDTVHVTHQCGIRDKVISLQGVPSRILADWILIQGVVIEIPGKGPSHIQGGIDFSWLLKLMTEDEAYAYILKARIDRAPQDDSVRNQVYVKQVIAWAKDYGGFYPR